MKSPQRTRTSKGFTLIELMVVIAIIVLAAGLMTPSVTEFFRNRQIEFLRGQITSAFNRARLRAVNQGVRMSLVFFKEGVCIYDEGRKTFEEDYEVFFNPETSPAGTDQVWIVLGFLGKKADTPLVPFREWEKRQEAQSVDTKGKTTGGAASEKQYNITGLPTITFERDGSLTFGSGSNVLSALFNEEIPENADVIVYQKGSYTACFVDLRQTGQVRSKRVLLRDPPEPPDEKRGTSQ